MGGFSKSEYVIFIGLICLFLAGTLNEKYHPFKHQRAIDEVQQAKLIAFEQTLLSSRYRKPNVKPVPIDTAIKIIDINDAQLEDWEQLPKIGPVLAQRILDFRGTNGAFKSIEQLIEVNGIGQKKLDAIRPYLVIIHK
ncbi:helix-hairpin-helix domain-containing protein [candidate division KSB1 bacterium]|nr:helix-hairpin-helix domain-containing protein [candidate division KSB1 bacterium]